MSVYPHLIPDYSDSVQPNAQSGRHDKILVDVEGWIGSGTDEAFRDFRSNLAGLFGDDSGEYSLFNSPGNKLHPTSWRIRKRTSPTSPRVPLFSGKLTAASISTDQGHRWRFTAQLALNPTRWLNQQSVGIVRRPVSVWINEPSQLFHNREVSNMYEVPLVRGNNVHIGSQRLLSLARPTAWMENVRRYLNSVIGLISGTLQQAAEETTGFAVIDRQILFKIKEIETYWEYWSERPLEEMSRLISPIQGLAASSSTAWTELSPEACNALLQDGSIEIGVDDNSPRIAMRVGPGSDLKIYAKTNKRLRFEVAYDCRKARHHFEPRTKLTIDQVIERLHHARVIGAQSLSEILEYARLQNPSPERREIHELFSEIFRTVSKPEMASLIISILVSTGRIVTGHRFNISVGDIRRLHRRGIVTRVATLGGNTTWTVAEPYRYSLSRLRGA